LETHSKQLSSRFSTLRKHYTYMYKLLSFMSLVMIFYLKECGWSFDLIINLILSPESFIKWCSLWNQQSSWETSSSEQNS
jgi:hypothetical protein